jgi:hypothetical protein
MPRGPAKLTDAVVAEICEEVANGKTMSASARERGITPSAVRKALLRNDALFQLSTHARELGCDALADQCIEIADSDEMKADDKRVRIDTRIRLIGKWSSRYSDKVTVENNTTVTHRYDLDNLPAAELDALERILANASGSAGGEGETVASSVH